MRNLRTLVTILAAAVAFGLPVLGTAAATGTGSASAAVTTTGTADAGTDDTPWG
jgi:hypothetical protein